MSFPRYPNYRDSSLEWLGDLPTHWNISRLGFESWVRARLGWKGLKAEEYVDDGFVFLATPNIKGQAIDFDNVNYINEQRYDESPEIKLRIGDVLLAKDGSTLGTVNVVRTLPRPATVNSSIAVITPGSRLSGVFLYYLFESSYMENTIQQIKGGMGVPHLFQEDLNKFYLPVPTLPEQAAIAAFLDRETAKIDGLVGEQRRLIELLKEKRQAIISHAVTKGLNPNAAMRPSGIEWLGDVPEHWRSSALKHLARAGAKTFTDGDWIEAPYITSAGVRLIQTGNVGIGFFKEQGFRFVSNETFEELGCTEVKPRDVLICRLDGPVGRACLAPDLGVRMITSVDNAILKCADDVVPEFVVALLSSIPWISWIDALCRVGGGFRLRVSRSQLGEIRAPVPPFEEQLAVSKYLVSETSKWDTLTAEAERAIDLLQERRTALISAAVTGEIDVRGLAEKEAA